jgi:hypothetical protein
MELARRYPRLLGSLAVLSTLAFAACNAITGAEDLELVGVNEEHDGEGDSTGNPPNGAGSGSDHSSGAAEGGASGSRPGGTGGQGGASGSGHGGTGEGGSGGELGGQAGAPGITTSSTTTTTTTTTGASPVDCIYPDSGFGVQVGNVVQGDLSWQGYAESSSQTTTISIQDYYDCDGSKGINALLIVSSATWCGACQEEATDLPSHAASFKQKGIRILTLMVENASAQPATLSTATQWRDNFGLDAYATCADPGFDFAGNGSVGLPLQIIVDPRTMKIVDRQDGYAGYSTLTQLADKNAN